MSTRQTDLAVAVTIHGCPPSARFLPDFCCFPCTYYTTYGLLVPHTDTVHGIEPDPCSGLRLPVSYGRPDIVRMLTQRGDQFSGSTVKHTFARFPFAVLGSTTPSYESVNRILGKIAEFAKLASERARGGAIPKFYLIVDEINRANLATVFGELIYGLEYRNSRVSTPYEVKEKISGAITKDIILGKNLYILGTMNTADKSIDAID